MSDENSVPQINRFRISAVRLLSVPHCVDVGLVHVSQDKSPCGEPVGWCEDSDLGMHSRGEEFAGLRIWNQHYGDCWGHTLKQWIPAIFDAK